jgi:hypothetical protein
MASFSSEVTTFFGQDDFAISQSKLIIRNPLKLMDLGEDLLSFIFDFASFSDCAKQSSASKKFNAMLCPKVWNSVTFPTQIPSDVLRVDVGGKGKCEEKVNNHQWFHLEHTTQVTLGICCLAHSERLLECCLRACNLKHLRVEYFPCNDGDGDEDFVPLINIQNGYIFRKDAFGSDVPMSECICA